MHTIDKFIEVNEPRFLNELFGLLSIPSVSSLSEHAPDMQRAAQYWCELLLKDGCDQAMVMPTKGYPVVYAQKIIDPSLPTVMVYGHYDVMPVDPPGLWTSAPFKPEIRNGKIWGRGADDNKGQSFMHAKAFEYMVTTGTLPCNVKFMIEGEEEVGSPNLLGWLKESIDMLRADIILVSDTSLLAEDVPSITTGLRGLSYMEVEVVGPSRDLHSGLFGGAVANPANILARMIASLHDEQNRITIPGFYDEVLPITDQERVAMAQAPFDEAGYCRSIGINEVWGEQGYSPLERVGIRPTLDVNGIVSGYTGEGAKTVLPSVAKAKISMRLVPNQDENKIAALFEKHMLSIAPRGVNVKVKALHGGPGYVSPTNSNGYLAASMAMETIFGAKPIPYRSGGSIPIISAFEQILGIKSILMGFGLESDAIHSPNENFPLKQLRLGIRTIPHFFSNFTKLQMG